MNFRAVKIIHPSIVPSLVLAIVFFLFSVIISERIHLFLLWNLLLALVPLLIANSLEKLSIKTTNVTLLKGLLFLLWLLFLPNAFYFITDLLHLDTSSFRSTFSRNPTETAFSNFFDLLLFASFVWVGALVGFLSLRKVHLLIERTFVRWVSTVIVAVVLFLSSVGIYLGRIVRLNSWDVLVSPTRSLYQATQESLSFGWREMVVFVVMFSTLLLVIYWTIYFRSSTFSDEKDGQN